MAKPRILVDLHHQYLMESLAILFEDRLGFEMFRPIGVEWWREGFWMVFDALETAEQFLGLHHGHALMAYQREHPDGNVNWLNSGLVDKGSGFYEVPCLEFHPRIQHCITLEAAKEFKFDYVLSSTPDHFSRYEKFRQLYQPHAKHLWQSGNPWACPPGAKNVLNSTTVPMPTWTNEVKYHQEFDVKNRFYPDPTCRKDTVANLLHYGDIERFLQVEATMLDWRFLAHGAGNRDKSIPEHIFEATLRKEIGFVWHSKNEDGYGFNLHCAAACGKPIVCNASRLANQKAGPLLVPGETCLNLDTMTNADIAANLRRMREDYPAISEGIRKNFEEVVNFDREFEDIKKWLERCV